MGKVTTYCQVSGCSPEVEEILDFDALSECFPDDDEDEDNSPETKRKVYEKLREAINLLATEDENEGSQALSIIGKSIPRQSSPFDDSNRPIWGFEDNPDDLNGILAEAEGRIRALSGCRMGGMFDMGFCEGPNGSDDGALVSYGGYFFVQTMMLAILSGATRDRVSVQRLWRLAMIKGHYDPHNDYALPGVDYGPINDYLDQFPWLLGDITRGELSNMGCIGTAEEIAEVLKKRGFWMWMRPDRFPIDPVTTPQPLTNITEEDISERVPHRSVSKLPPEIVRSIALELSLQDIITFATLSKVLYYRVLGNQETRDSLAKAYIHRHARWCLPSGETELRWWNERRGDDVLGWDYLRRCWSESHSMRNRRRIWRAAQSIEEECEREEARLGIVHE